MRRKGSAFGSAAALLAAAFMWLSPSVEGQGAPGGMTPAPTQPRAAPARRPAAPRQAATASLTTPWGHPDLQGSWNNQRGVPMENPANLKKLGPRPEIDRFPGADRVWSEGARERSNQTSLIIDPPDGLIPFKPGLRQEIDTKIAQKRSVSYLTQSYEERDAYERCISRGLPGAMIAGFYNHNYQIFQTPDHVVILVEMIHDARIIPLDGRPPLPKSVSTWMGDSRGRWEGKTLVVETTNFNGKVAVANQSNTFGLTPTGRVVERFTRIDADTIDYQYTVEDPAYFTRPFTVSDQMRKLDAPIYEYACQEANYALPNIIRGAQAQEQQRRNSSGGVPK